MRETMKEYLLGSTEHYNRMSLKQREQRTGYAAASRSCRCEQCDCDPCECEDHILKADYIEREANEPERVGEHTGTLEDDGSEQRGPI